MIRLKKMGRDLLQMFSLSQYIYCIIALLFSLSLTHTQKKKNKLKNTALITLFLFEWIIGSKQGFVWRWKQRPIIMPLTASIFSFLVGWVVHSHILKDGKLINPTRCLLPYSSALIESISQMNRGKKKKRKKCRDCLSLERMKDSNFLHVLS